MEIVCSAIAGICARILCHPLDTIKTVAFTGFAGEQHAAIAREAPHSFASVVRSIWASEGIAGFYRGVGVAAVGSAPGVALYLTTYDRCSAAWKAFGDAPPAARSASGSCSTRDGESSVTAAVLVSLRRVAGGTPPSARFFVCGLVAETVSCLVWVPVDVAKERLQSQPRMLQRRYTSSLDALHRILTNEGLRGLYKGYWSTLGSFGPFSAVYFVFYEYFTNVLKMWYMSSTFVRPLSKAGGAREAVKDTNAAALSPTAKFAVALGAGAGGNVVASLCTNPLELVKTRLQVQRAVLYRQTAASTIAVHPKLYTYHYQGIRDGLVQMARTEGVRALWRGVGSRIAYTAPNAALTMGFFELLKSKLM